MLALPEHQSLGYAMESLGHSAKRTRGAKLVVNLHFAVHYYGPKSSILVAESRSRRRTWNPQERRQNVRDGKVEWLLEGKHCARGCTPRPFQSPSKAVSDFRGQLGSSLLVGFLQGGKSPMIRITSRFSGSPKIEAQRGSPGTVFFEGSCR